MVNGMHSLNVWWNGECFI